MVYLCFLKIIDSERHHSFASLMYLSFPLPVGIEPFLCDLDYCFSVTTDYRMSCVTLDIAKNVLLSLVLFQRGCWGDCFPVWFIISYISFLSLSISCMFFPWFPCCILQIDLTFDSTTRLLRDGQFNEKWTKILNGLTLQTMYCIKLTPLTIRHSVPRTLILKIYMYVEGLMISCWQAWALTVSSLMRR